MNDLNLLLKRQIINHSSGNVNVNCYSTNSPPEEACYEEKYTKAYIIPRKSTFHYSELENHCENLKIELANRHLEESAALEKHKRIYEKYSFLETLLEYIANYIECLVLETKSAFRLSSSLNSFIIHEDCMTEKTSNFSKTLIEVYDFSTLAEIKEQLTIVLNESNNNIGKLSNELLERQNKYKLAMKNFKIILEILNVNEDSLKKLKRQFDEVLMDYQQCLCILNHELSFAIAERTKVLVNCLSSLEGEYDLLMDRRNALKGLLKDAGKSFAENKYILGNDDIVSSHSSSDNE